MSLVDLRLGDSLAVLPELADASVDALVTDPPAGIGFMGKAWDTFGGVRTNPRAEADRAAASGRGGKSTQPFGYSGHALGSLGRERPAFIAFLTAVLAECYRVLKPGAHAFVWAIPRTSHWTATAIEDAGFEVRDVVVHLFGSGFPKSLDVSKAIDKAAGAEREDVYADRAPVTANQVYGKGLGVGVVERHPATDDAARWAGWGTSLKPAAEHWILARKPLSEPNVAANVLRWGTGALNIDGCRVGTVGENPSGARRAVSKRSGVAPPGGSIIMGDRDLEHRPGETLGRWPANVTLDEDAAAALDEQSGQLTSGKAPDGGLRRVASLGDTSGVPIAGRSEAPGSLLYGDTGGASRFYYTAKASRSERNEGLGGFDERPLLWSSGKQSPGTFQAEGTHRAARNHHPTVKPVELMRYLIRLICPPGGVVLDPFMGSGSTGIAAFREGFGFIGIERDPDYFAIARSRWNNQRAAQADLMESGA